MYIEFLLVENILHKVNDTHCMHLYIYLFLEQKYIYLSDYNTDWKQLENKL
jgi:hypothetical protein